MTRRLYSYVLLGSLVFAGCAYYNTFYNARQYYKKAEEQRLKRRTDRPSQSEIESYQKAIEKAGKVIQNHPKSRYVDDAILLMGKAFYYQDQVGSAQRKFEELLTYFPESNYAPEAHLWLARCLIALNEYGAAEQELNSLLAREKLPGKVRDESFLLLGDLYLSREEYANALDAYREAAKRIDEKTLKAQSYLRVGECANYLEDYETAADAFRRAVKYTETTEKRYLALSSYGLALKAMGKYDEAIKSFERILRDGSMNKFWPDAKYEIGDAAYAKGEREYAIRWFEGVIEDHDRTEAAAKSHFRLGQIYLHDFADYKAAKEHFDKVRSTYSRAEVVPEAVQTAQNIDQLLQLRELVSKQEKQLAKGDTTLVEVGEEVRRRLRPGDEYFPEWLADSTLTRRDSLTLVARMDSLIQRGIDADSAALFIAERDTNLYWLLPPDSLVYVYQHWENVDSVWTEIEAMQREREQMTAAERRALAAARAAGRRKEQQPTIQAATPENVARNKLKLGEIFLLQFDKPDTALAYYMDIIQNYPETSVAPQAMYSIAYILEDVEGDTATADSVRSKLAAHYPDTPQAEKARQELGLTVERKGPNGARKIYLEAENLLWDKNDPRGALNAYVDLVAKYPESELVPKAMYAAGWICENLLDANTQAAQIYQELIDNHPDNPFAKKVKAPLDELKRAEEEKQKGELLATTAATDSTASETGAPSDSAELVLSPEPGSTAVDTAKGHRLPRGATAPADSGARVVAAAPGGQPESSETSEQEPPADANAGRTTSTIADSVDEAPAPVDGLEALQAQLRIPPEARNAVLPGTVIVNVLVDKRGAVRDVKLVTSVKNSAFEMAALRAIRQVRWKPAILNGRPVRAWAQVPLDFLKAKKP